MNPRGVSYRNLVMPSKQGVYKRGFLALLSFLRRQESCLFNNFWVPAFTGMTKMTFGKAF